MFKNDLDLCVGNVMVNKCKQMTYGISMLITSPSCILEHKILISNIPMCYTKYHVVKKYAHQEVAYVSNSGMLRPSGCDTTSPLDIYFRPIVDSIHNNKYHKWWWEISES
jgi:hypothetical protein